MLLRQNHSGDSASRILGLMLFILTLLLPPIELSAAPANSAANTPGNSSSSNVAAETPAQRPIPPTQARRKAGILAGTGLVALSIVVLATGFALLHAFKQR